MSESCGIDDQRAQADQDPGPGPQDVVGDVEEQDRAQRVLLRLGGQHALGDVAAAARLGAGIPDRPPLHGDGHDEDGHGHVPVVREVGQHVQVVEAVRARSCAESLATRPRRPPTCGSLTAK